jgi:hypothetical protein
MDYETILTVFLVIILLWFSLDFDKHYSETLHSAARHPFIRFLAGSTVVYLATINPVLATLAFMIVFFWIADVNFLSSFAL